MIKLHDLVSAYDLCRRNCRRSEDLIRFERNKYAYLNRLLQQVNSRTYHSEYSYSFIHHRPKAREIFGAEVSFKTLMMYVDIRLRPIVESQLSDRTFNNRKGKGTSGAIKQLINDIELNKSDSCTLIKIDFKGYFPNMNQEVAWQKILEIIKLYKGEDTEDILYICKFVCFFNPQFNSYRKSSINLWKEIPDYKSLYSKPWGVGAVIGFLFWLQMSNIYLNGIDHWILKEVTPFYVRFVDDLVFVTNNKQHVLHKLPELRAKLSQIFVQVHPTKFYCLPWYNGIEFLGFHIKKNKIHLNNRTKLKAYSSKLNPSYLGLFMMTNDGELDKYKNYFNIN